MAELALAAIAGQALARLVSEPGTCDVLVNGPHGIWVDRGEGLRQVAVDLGDAEQLRALAVRLAAHGGQRLDEASPVADVRLPESVRLHAVLPPIAPTGPLLSLRVLRGRSFTLPELITAGMVDAAGAELLAALIAVKANVLISGATGTGKTTLLASLLGLVPPTERIVVIEESGELDPDHPHVVRLESRRANAEGRGELDLSVLVRQALRMRPDRIVLGECRGAEVRDVLTALNTGHEGGAATVHANTARDVPARLAALGALAGLDTAAVVAQAGAALDAIVHLRREAATSGGRRTVAEIATVVVRDGALIAEPAVTFTGGQAKTGPGWPVLAERCGWRHG